MYNREKKIYRLRILIADWTPTVTIGEKKTEYNLSESLIHTLICIYYDNRCEK